MQIKMSRILLTGLSVLLVAAGVGVMAYPRLAAGALERQRDALAEEWQTSMRLLAKNPQPAAMPDINQREPAASTGDDQAAIKQAEYIKKTTMGLLSIEKIGFTQPVLKGITEQNLKLSVATIEPAPAPGGAGNLSVAGHNSLDYGQNFNRLEELEIGDKIQLDTGGQVYTYLVTQRLNIEPEDTWVTAGQGEKSVITLITCTPRNNPLHRFAIRAELQSESP